MTSREIFRRVAVGIAVTTALAAGFIAWRSTLLGEYSVMDMGGANQDAGSGGAVAGGHGGHGAGAGTTEQAGTVSVTSLTADPERPADVRVELTARQQAIAVPGGRAVEGYTLNGQSPGPEIRARQGDLVEVEFVNESVAAGATLHWHGIDVPNAADGVAGITQDAVPVGGRFVYRFEAKDAGTYWYHSHQVSHEQVRRGLLGAIVIEPAEASSGNDSDVVALLHIYDGQHTLNGRAEDQRVAARPGETVRVRVVNTDNGTATLWSAAPFRVLAIDGTEVNAPTDVKNRRVLVAAGGRVDIAVQAPPDGATRLHLGGARSILVGDPDASEPPAPQPSDTLDLLAYGDPAPLGFDPSSPDRTFDYVIGRRFGIIDGRPGNFWTINGRMFPDIPMFHVREGDIVVIRIVNDTSETHPIHLHGHHAVVLSRDGVAASGSPWWTDTLDVFPGETYEVAFVADNPGIWSDHCHNLPHAVDGLIAHVMYEGVSTPFTINGDAGNHPE